MNINSNSSSKTSAKATTTVMEKVASTKLVPTRKDQNEKKGTKGTSFIRSEEEKRKLGGKSDTVVSHGGKSNAMKEGGVISAASVKVQGQKRLRDKEENDDDSSVEENASNSSEEGLHNTVMVDGDPIVQIVKSPTLINLHVSDFRAFWKQRIRYEKNCKSQNQAKVQSLSSSIDDNILEGLKLMYLKSCKGSTLDEKLRYFFKKQLAKKNEIHEVNLEEILGNVKLDYNKQPGEDRCLCFMIDIISALKAARIWHAHKDKGLLTSIVDLLVHKINDNSVKGLMLNYMKVNKKFKSLKSFIRRLQRFEEMHQRVKQGEDFLRKTQKMPTGTTSSFKQQPQPQNQPMRKKRRTKLSAMDKCFRCGQTGHRSYECKAPPDKVEQHKKDFLAQKPPKMDNSNVKKLSVNNIEVTTSNDTNPSLINGKVSSSTYPVLLDTGANRCFVGFSLTPFLIKDGCSMQSRGQKQLTLADGSETYSLGVLLIPCLEIYKVKLLNLECNILPGDQNKIILGTDVLHTLGINLKGILSSLKEKSINFEDQQMELSKGLEISMIFEENGHQLKEKESLYFGDSTDIPSSESLFNYGHGFTAGQQRYVQLFYDIVLVPMWKKTYNVQPMKVPEAIVTLNADAMPFRGRVCKYSEKEKSFVDKMISELLAADCIEACNDAQWSCPVIVVNDAEGEPKRMVTDLKQVNKICQKIFWQMPDIESELLKASSKQWFTVVDLAKGYWQYPLEEKSGKILSFHTYNSVYRYKRLPQGYTNSVFLFQSLISGIIRQLGLESKVIVWIDDILIATKTLLENVHYLSLILNKFGELNVKINWTKSKFFKRYIKYLGRDIDGSGISFDEEKVSTMANIPNPRTASELMAFINSCSFMRSIIPNFAALSTFPCWRL